MDVRSDTAETLVDEVFLFGRALRQALAANHDDPVPQALLGVLVVLAGHGECRPSELANELCISQSALSRQLAELVDAGYVVRRPDPLDGRAAIIAVSERGFDMLERSKQARAARLRNVLTDWQESDAQAAIVSVRKLVDVLTEHAHRAHLATA